MSEPPGGLPVDSSSEAQDELEQLRAAAEQERAARAAAEARAAALERELAQSRSRSVRAYEAIEQLRDELDGLRVRDEEKKESGALVGAHAIGASQHSTSSPPTRAVQQDTARMPRPVQLQAPRTAGRWLERALRQLARRSPSLAGRLLVVLVEGAEMDQERLVRLLAAGPLKRGRARALGETPSFDALKRRLAAPGTMAELRLEPGLSLALAAVMIDGRWTTGERFTLAYRLPNGGTPGPCLEVNDGAPVTVSGEADCGAITTTVVCPADHLPAVLSGQRPPGTKIEGETRQLELIRVWLERAQSD